MASLFGRAPETLGGNALKTSYSLIAASAFAATSATAGGFELSTQAVDPLFFSGRHLEFTAAYAKPDLEGTDFFGNSTGDIAPNFWAFGGAFKDDINERLSYAIIADQPYYALLSAPAGVFTGTNATIETYSLSGLLRYKFTDRISVYGGPRIQTVTSSAGFPAGGGFPAYDMQGDRATDVGFTIGAAYEIPEYFTRVSLTYHSKIKHDIDVTENGVQTGSTELIAPEAVNLDFQVPVNRSTLVFGGVRWVAWEGIELTAPQFGPLVTFAEDTITYRLGAVHQLNDTWSLLAQYSYEGKTDDEPDILYPYNGIQGLTLGAIYTRENMTVTAGATYFRLGSVSSPTLGEFDDNKGLGLGFNIAFKL